MCACDIHHRSAARALGTYTEEALTSHTRQTHWHRSAMASLGAMGSYTSDRETSDQVADAIEKAQEEAHARVQAARRRMDHMGSSYQSAPLAASSRRSASESGLSRDASSKSSAQKGRDRERVERAERADRVERVGRGWPWMASDVGVGGAAGDSVGGKQKGSTLTSSSNEESGATDGSSTHGN